MRGSRRCLVIPSRKWLVAQVTALGALATMFVTTGSWDQEESVALIGLLVTAASTYLVPNAPGQSGIAGEEGQP